LLTRPKFDWTESRLPKKVGINPDENTVVWITSGLLVE
jgi:hypothetical protein